MALKDEWKNTGKGLGKAFAGLGKNIGRSVVGAVDKLDGTTEDSTVFNDGSWRGTGKDIGNAFKNLGKSVLHSAESGLEKIDVKSTEETDNAGEKSAEESSYNEVQDN